MQSRPSETLLSIPDTQCHRVMHGKREAFASGTLTVILAHPTQNPADDTLFMMLGQFIYPLRKDVPCLKSDSRTFLFPMPGNVIYGIVLPRHVEVIVICGIDDA